MMRLFLLTAGAVLCTTGAARAQQAMPQLPSTPQGQDGGQGPQQVRRVISPHIEVGQILTADLQNGDVLTYTTVGAGVDVAIQTRRVQVQLNYQYQHAFSYDRNVGDQDIHSGLARAAVTLAPGLSLEGGALATRARSDNRGADPVLLTPNAANVSQVYSAYIQPTLAKRVGPAYVNALYRFGYTKVESPSYSGVSANQPVLDNYDDSTSHLLMGSVGFPSGSVLPVGVTWSGAYQLENAGQLDQRYEGLYLREDLVLPVSRTVAALGGIGYEHIKITQRDALLDTNGNPVLDGNGRYVTDPASPRRIAYDTKTPVFWDVGVLWRPSPRTTLEARVGRRYDSWSYTGSFSHQIGPGSGLQIGVYDSMQSFGRQLNGALSSLPTSYSTTDDPLNDNYNGCVFGTQGNTPGGCLTGVLQSIATANYRARGVDAVIAFNRGLNRVGAGVGYTNRRFYAPDSGTGFSIDGTTDEGYYGQVFAAHALTAESSVNANAYINYFRSGIVGANGVLGAGATGSYNRSFGRLGASVSAGIYAFDQKDSNLDDVTAQALLALGYRF
ncbi:hypothetical protein GCM10023219_04670 [Stakelama sediminis]|uniref:Preprotein translocase subunit YajC n=1 Tax=Stakelama sediminis TaxID=463200 RepID=A0A840YUB7_9SPHN|nr:hypothetical protein [Stakelama sediminis]MBB5717182.1 hypothetical protein [Stakelama sediminis]